MNSRWALWETCDNDNLSEGNNSDCEGDGGLTRERYSLGLPNTGLGQEPVVLEIELEDPSGTFCVRLSGRQEAGVTPSFWLRGLGE